MSFIKHSFSVIVGGIDVTGNFLPRLKGFEYSHAAGKAASSASFELSDKDGQIAMLQDRSPPAPTGRTPSIAPASPCAAPPSGGWSDR